ncbi:zinc-ribbon domain-containing protein [Massiliimalia timonensis]|uniref:zinc-ribbon domain-containing protein n=1 Tax=Massiliimalia timonensis TaxID=1987501 RepID=UPI00189D8509|nr:zinc-ribbon domain-containing protein [Massiliimalia timonensis]
MENNYETRTDCCTRCGAPLETGEKFCTKCGEPIEKTMIINNQIISQNNKKNSGLGIAAFVLSVIGFMTSCFVIGIIFDIIAFVFAIIVLKKAKSNNLKKGFAVTGITISGVSLLLCVILVLPSLLDNPIFKKTEANYIQSKGIYLLDKENTELDFTKDKLEQNENYLVVVFDIDNSTNKNWEDKFFWSEGIKLKLGENVYTEYHDSELIREFQKNSGYKNSNLDTILADSHNRLTAVFRINSVDINDDLEGTLKVDFDYQCIGKIHFTDTDIKSFKFFDDILIDVDGEDYQVARSVSKRIEYLKAMQKLFETTAYICADDVDVGAEKLVESKQVWEGTKMGGISITSKGKEPDPSFNYDYFGSPDLPKYDAEKVKKFYPEIGEKLSTFYSNFDKLYDFPLKLEVQEISDLYKENNEIISELEEFFR